MDPIVCLGLIDIRYVTPPRFRAIVGFERELSDSIPALPGSLRADALRTHLLIHFGKVTALSANLVKIIVLLTNLAAQLDDDSSFPAIHIIASCATASAILS